VLSVGRAGTSGLLEEGLLLARVGVHTEVADTVLETSSFTSGGVGSGTNSHIQSVAAVVEGDFEILPCVGGSDDIAEDLATSRFNPEGLLSPGTNEVESESEGKGGVSTESRV